MENEGLSAWVEVLPDFKKFKSQSETQMTGILGSAGDKSGNEAGRRAGGGIVAGLGKALPVILAGVAALGIGTLIGNSIGTGINYALNSIDLASNLSETKSAVSTLFGDAAVGIEDYSKTAVQALGQTQQEALAAAQTFGIFGKAAGLQGGELSSFSTELVGLSADLASFFNTDSQTAIDAIGAGLRGESEPLRQFGVLLDDATLKSRAMALGIFDGNGALTQQQRVLAAQAEILAQTGDAQGDVARTSGGLAFQQKQLTAALEQTQVSLGEQLLPAFTEFVTLANDELVPILGDVIAQVGPVLSDALVESLPAIKDLITELAPLIPQLVELGVSALPVFVQLLTLLAPVLIDAAANATSVYTVVGGFLDLLKGDTSLSQFSADIVNMGGSFSAIMASIRDAITSMGAGITGFITGAVNTLIGGLNSLGDAAESFVNSFSKISGIKIDIKDIPKLLTMSAAQAAAVAAAQSGPSTSKKKNSLGFADGGLITARPGGVDAVIGEGKYNEAVLPLNDYVFRQISKGINDVGGSGGGGANIYVTTDDPLRAAVKTQQILNGRLATS